MQIQPPSDEEKKILLAANAHRYPQGAKIPVLGDGGGRVVLPILLGLPSGACRLPDDPKEKARVSPVWRAVVDAILQQEFDYDAIAEQLVSDCVLWPDPRVLAAWRNRWPGIARDVAVTALRLCAVLPEAIDEPALTDEPPAAIIAALAEHPRATWRWLRPRGGGGPVFAVAVESPDGVKYDAFDDAMRRKEIDPFVLARELVDGQVVARMRREGEAFVEATAAEIFDRYPGLVILVAAVVRRLARAQGEIVLGEW